MDSDKPPVLKSEDKTNLAIIEMLNEKHHKDFRKIPYSERILVIPNCMRNVEVCEAENTKNGYACTHCGGCSISDIKYSAEKLGYTVVIVPGGRMVYKVLKKIQPKAAVGIACPFELAEAMENVSKVGIPCQGILLDKDGCKNTCVNKESTIKFLHLNGHKIDAYEGLDDKEQPIEN